MTKILTPDLCVIGGGSGGLSVAAGAAQMGARVVLIEGGRMGGDCLNYGCVPSKALIAAAGRAQAMRNAGGFGIAPATPQIDFAAVMDHVQATIAAIAPHDSVERFEGLGVVVLRDWARFVSPREVVAGEHRIRPRRFVIATGSSPLVPLIPGLKEVPYLTNETLFDLRERPAHLVVIGGGPIGLEMAQAFRRLGAQVTVIEAARAFGRDDPELAAIALVRLRAEGVEILENTSAASVEGRDGAVAVTTSEGARIEGSHLLVAVGRRPNIGRLNLEAAGIATERGAIRVNAGLRTTNRRAFAIGDVAGGLQFTHVAGYHGGLVVRAALLGLPVTAREAHIPRATYTDPELAQVGLTEAEARDRHGDRLEVVRIPYAANDRAVATRQTDGLVKLMAVRGRVVGAGIVGAQAGELIQPFALAVSAGLKLSKLAGMVAPYPTLGELAKRAAGAYFAPRLFDSPLVRGVVRAVQMLP